MKLKYGEVMNEGFAQAIQKLANHPMNLKVSYTVNKIISDIEKKRKEVIKEAEAFFKDKSNDPEKLKGLEEDFSQYMFSVDRDPIKLSQIRDFKITPRELEYLKPVLDQKDLDNLDGNPLPPLTPVA